jgi:polysaccharide export outer membrane protein
MLPPEYGEFAPPPLPTEKLKVSFPPYVIEAPDVVTIDVIGALPKGAYQVQPLDALVITSLDGQSDSIAGVFHVTPDGQIDLGPKNGTVAVADLSLDHAQEAVQKHLAARTGKGHVSVSLAQTNAVKQIRGDHIVRPDGTVGLGDYGSVFVAGMTLDDAKTAIESHLGRRFSKPVVSLDVRGFNSKYYYVVVNVAGLGETVHRFIATGNETVLDAVAHVHFAVPAVKKQRVWVARPAPPNADGADQILPVNWNEVTQAGGTRTNYQLLPGDRVYVQANR